MDLPKSNSIPPPPASDFPSPPKPPPPASQPPSPNPPSTTVPSSTGNPSPSTVATPSATASAPVSPLDTFPFPPPTIPPSILKPAKSEGQGTKSRLPFIILSVFFLFVLLLSGAAYAVAYEKIKIGNSQLENQVSDFVQGLSFTPKTPKYLLVSAARAHQKISRHRFDLSLATESDGLASSFGTNKLDIQAKGAVDYSDAKSPKLTLSASLTKDFSLDVRKPDKIIYFKINNLPPLLLTVLGFSPGPQLDAVLENWFSYDTSTLDTEARKSLDENKTGTSFTNQFTEKTIDSLLEEKVWKSIKVTQENMDNFETYRLNLIVTKEILDVLDKNLQNQIPKEKSLAPKTKLSDYISDLVFDLWIDKKDYYVRKLSASFKAKSGNLGTMSFLPIPTLGNLTQTTTKFSGVLKLSGFQEPVNIERPTNSIPYDQYLMLLMEQSQTYKQSQRQMLDAKRKVDLEQLRTALELCQVDSLDNTYVQNLNDLVTCKTISIIPTDPETSLPYEYLPTPDRKGFILKSRLSDESEYTLTSP